MVKRSVFLISILVLGGAGNVVGQLRTVVGRVTDAVTGQPVSQGVITVKGERVRDELRPDGVFVLRVPDSVFTATVKADGYRTQTIDVTEEQVTVFVTLQPLALSLSGVVATAVGHDEAVVSRTRLGPAPQSNLLGGLQGKVAGADVQLNSGVPGGDFQLTLRGIKTILGASSPLYVVDGTYVSNASVPSGVNGVIGGNEALPSRVLDLNPEDIESIRFLKGAAAATLYGSKGSNGVVIITTRRGRGGGSH